MECPEIVIDTNVLVAGLRSRRGAAFKLLSLVGTGLFGINLSVPLVLEYEEVLLRPESGITLSQSDLVGCFGLFLCSCTASSGIFLMAAIS